ncbi:uncharacterized protein LOC115886612 [Sitophilus oryzae]|uniref:Uncharacterized protein LOC115886612 n=1 Tax=Sitophilus oryzae TaxID=7048 RepID=A0A6J2YE87_SITOR|nr:uncharacterized protein LOC115886612 [Sitophilus oryzae]
MSPEANKKNTNKNADLNSEILKQALNLSEVAMDLRDHYIAGEKCINFFKSMINGAEKALNAIEITSKSSFNLANKLVENNINVPELSEELKLEYDQLQGLINKHLSDFNMEEHTSDKNKYLEAKRRNSENVLHGNSSSTKSLKNDVDEKYPENLSKESLIDLNNVVNLPPVPEDIFTSFSNNKPTRTSSLSSLKNMRKIKMFLQKAESDEEDSSDNDEHDYTKMVYGDNDESRTASFHTPSTRKLHLGYIKEESQD